MHSAYSFLHAKHETLARQIYGTGHGSRKNSHKQPGDTMSEELAFTLEHERFTTCQSAKTSTPPLERL
jgi:hypothetical protein